MITLSERLLWGRSEHRARHWSVYVGGFGGVVFVLSLAMLFGDGWGSRLASNLFPVAFFYAPPVVAALSGFRGGGLLVSLAVGLMPAILFGVVALVWRGVAGTGAGDGPLWGLLVAFGIIGVGGAVVGFAVGWGGVRLLRR
ncbi:hypothetical protein [Haladaptatus sp. NG-WS-4]